MGFLPVSRSRSRRASGVRVVNKGPTSGPKSSPLGGAIPAILRRIVSFSVKYHAMGSMIGEGYCGLAIRAGTRVTLRTSKPLRVVCIRDESPLFCVQRDRARFNERQLTGMPPISTAPGSCREEF